MIHFSSIVNFHLLDGEYTLGFKLHFKLHKYLESGHIISA